MKFITQILIVLSIIYLNTNLKAQSLPRFNTSPEKKQVVSSTEKQEMFSSSECFNGLPNNGNFEQFIFGSSTNCGVPSNYCSYNTGFGCSSATAPFQASSCNYTWGGWWVSHGTPEIWYDENTDNHAALIWSGRWNQAFYPDLQDNKTYGEGLFLNCNTFEKGKKYNLNIDFRTNNTEISHVFIKLIKFSDAPSNYNVSMVINSTYELPTVNDFQTIFHKENYTQSSGFLTEQISFIPNEDYDVIWIYPYSPKNQITYLYIDNVCIQCEQYSDNIIYTTWQSLPSYSYANNTILAMMSSQVLVNENVKLIAGNVISLGPSFKIQEGAVFEAYIDEEQVNCNLTNCSEGYTLRSKPPTKNNKKEKNHLTMNEIYNLDVNLTIFPNPAIRHFTINGLEMINNPVTVTLYDLTGRVIYSVFLQSGEKQILLPTTTKLKGLFFVKIFSKGNLLATDKLIIQA